MYTCSDKAIKDTVVNTGLCNVFNKKKDSIGNIFLLLKLQILNYICRKVIER